MPAADELTAAATAEVTGHVVDREASRLPGVGMDAEALQRIFEALLLHRRPVAQVHSD